MEYLDEQWTVPAANTCGCAVDLAITCALTYLLYRNRSGIAKYDTRLCIRIIYLAHWPQNRSPLEQAHFIRHNNRRDGLVGYHPTEPADFDSMYPQHSKSVADHPCTFSLSKEERPTDMLPPLGRSVPNLHVFAHPLHLHIQRYVHYLGPNVPDTHPGLKFSRISNITAYTNTVLAT